MALLRHIARSPCQDRRQFFCAAHARKRNLLWNSQLWLQSQDLFLGSYSSRQTAFHNPRYIFTFSQTQQSIFCKLLVGHAVQSWFIHMPGPGQHFVGRVFLTGLFVDLLAVQQIPDRHKQFVRDGHDRLVGMFPLAEPVIFRTPDWIRTDPLPRSLHQSPAQFLATHLRNPFFTMLLSTVVYACSETCIAH